jgi:alpha-tubulin suppressor-like RCC1 family protein
LGLGVAASDALVHVSGLPAIAAVSGGGTFTLAATRAGTVWVWGNDSSGQLGATATGKSGSDDPSPCAVSPVRVPSAHSIAKIAARSDSSLAIVSTFR